MQFSGVAFLVGVSVALTPSASEDNAGAWDTTKNRFSFDLPPVAGHLGALVGMDSGGRFINHRLSRVTYKPTNTLVRPTYGPLVQVFFRCFRCDRVTPA